MENEVLINSEPVRGPELSSEAALFNRRIDFHVSRKPFNGFSNNSSNGFKLVTLNPNLGTHQASRSAKKSERPERLDSGFDPEMRLEITFRRIISALNNHSEKNAGLLADGFGSTPEMCKRNLIWVVTKMQVLVDRYPTWGDVVQVDTWVAASGKNGMRRDWLVRDANTGNILTRASSLWVMMNKETRKLSKMPDEVREEIGGHFVDSPPIVDDDSRKLPKLDDSTADYIHNGLTPRWSDLDVNQHVNNVKYVGWILESAPLHILETHELLA